MGAQVDNYDDINVFGLGDFFKHPLGLFLGKIVVLFSCIYLFFPSFPDLKKLETNQNKYIALGLINNPRVLLKLSEIHEDRGHIDAAIRDITVAIGLLELHGVSKETMQLYTHRLEALNKIKENSLN